MQIDANENSREININPSNNNIDQESYSNEINEIKGKLRINYLKINYVENYSNYTLKNIFLFYFLSWLNFKNVNVCCNTTRLSTRNKIFHR